MIINHFSTLRGDMDVSNRLEFWLNGKRRLVVNPDPTQNIIEYVRSEGLTGTKLGCSEGGCGACTVTLSEWNSSTQKPKFYAVNGCITPIIAIEGKHIETVEGIGNSSLPHAAQERIAKFHGSQCGFCTPGIVMSLYATLRETEGQPTREQLSTAFDGNLCRCTGYKPIIDAADTFAVDGSKPVGCGAAPDGCCKSNMNGTSNGPCSTEKGENGCDRSQGCCKSQPVANGCGSSGSECCESTPNGLPLRQYPHSERIFPPALKKYESKFLRLEASNGSIWYRPRTLEELRLILQKHGDVHYVAGASEFQIEAKIKGDEHPVCVFLHDIKDLQGFFEESDKYSFGGNIRLSELEEHLANSGDQVAQAINEQLKYFAGRQIRNVATPAGNIVTASPIADLNPVFTALNAELTVVLADGGTKQIQMGDFSNPFWTGYRKTVLPKGCIITKISIPKATEGETIRSFKQAKRKDDDISIVTACMRCAVSDGVVTECAIAYGGVAPFTVLTGNDLVGSQVSDLQSNGLKLLEAQFKLPYNVPGGMAKYRRSLILSFFYKFVQSLLPSSVADRAALAEVTRKHPIGVRDLRNPYEQEILGKSNMHVSAMKQVTGEALYVDDIPAFRNELHAVQVLSTRAAAKVTKIDWSGALDLPGVEGVVDYQDVPGSNRWGTFVKLGPDTLFVEDGICNYVGDCIGLVVASSREIAEKAARKVRVEYESVGEPIITIEQAIEKESYFDLRPLVEKDDAKAALASSKYVFEGTARTGAQEHFYLEPQGALVIPQDNDEYIIYCSTQNPNETQLVASSALALPANRVISRVKRLGGGFGGKETRSVHYSTLAAIAAHKFRRPVRLILSRQEDMLQAGQRHPSLAKWKVGLDENLKFTALDVDLYFNAGYSLDLSKGVMDRGVLHVDNCYDFGAVRACAWPCRTNLASNTAFRGFGGPQGMFVAEAIIYEVSNALGIAPEELRARNYYPLTGGVTHYKQKLGEDFTVPIMAEKLLSDVDYPTLRKEVEQFNATSKWIKRGLASVPTKFGVSFGVKFLNQAGALVHIYEDGSVLLAHGGTEMGQGLHTKMTMIAAHELGVPVENVYINETSTETVANASPTAASASSDLNGGAIKNACDQINARLQPYREKLGPGATMREIAHACYFDRVNLSANGYYRTPDINYVFGDPNPGPAFSYYTQGVAVVMVEANTLTGDWANLRTDILMDIGRPINQAIDYGQIEGAFVQGQGLFTIEESLWNANGALITRGPGAYKIPGFRDIPQHFNVSHLQDRSFEHLKTIHGSKGIGEPPLFLGSAVLFALLDALKSARSSRGLKMLKGVNAPITTESIRNAAGDELATLAEVDKVGVPFSRRS